MTQVDLSEDGAPESETGGGCRNVRLKLRLFKGSLHEASDVDFCMTNMLTFFKQRILAIPARISRQLIGKKSFREIYDIIMTEIVSCLSELSGYDRNMFAQQRAARLADQGVDLTALNGQTFPRPKGLETRPSPSERR